MDTDGHLSHNCSSRYTKIELSLFKNISLFVEPRSIIPLNNYQRTLFYTSIPFERKITRSYRLFLECDKTLRVNRSFDHFDPIDHPCLDDQSTIVSRLILTARLLSQFLVRRNLSISFQIFLRTFYFALRALWKCINSTLWCALLEPRIKRAAIKR